MRYIALLRGINVGGNNTVRMPDLKQCFEHAGYERVKTYINSGNVLFETAETDSTALARAIERILEGRFGFPIGVTIASEARWQKIINEKPEWWGTDATMKHNLIIMMEPYDMEALLTAIGAIKSDYERMQPGDGVIYQALSLQDFGKTVGGKLAGNPVYKRMTVRNFNTSMKLLDLIKEL